LTSSLAQKTSLLKNLYLIRPEPGSNTLKSRGLSTKFKKVKN
jgi:hypothetical protein